MQYIQLSQIRHVLIYDSQGDEWEWGSFDSQYIIYPPRSRPIRQKNKSKRVAVGQNSAIYLSEEFESFTHLFRAQNEGA